MEIVQELAEQLGVAVENLLSAYAPYCLGVNIGVVVASFIVLVGSIIVLILSLNTMMHNYNMLCNNHDKFPSERPQVWVHGVIAVIMLFAAIISLVVFVICLPNLIGAIMSPEGAAIADIVDKIKG